MGGGKGMNKRIKQNPVAWAVFIGDAISVIDQTKEPYTAAGIVKPLYEEPPKREWVGLTDDDEVEFEWERVTGHSIFGGDPWDGRQMFLSPNEILAFVKAIETKLREKNMEVEE
jgi:hypothetical protein